MRSCMRHNKIQSIRYMHISYKIRTIIHMIVHMIVQRYIIKEQIKGMVSFYLDNLVNIRLLIIYKYIFSWYTK